MSGGEQTGTEKSDENNKKIGTCLPSLRKRIGRFGMGQLKERKNERAVFAGMSHQASGKTEGRFRQEGHNRKNDDGERPPKRRRTETQSPRTGDVLPPLEEIPE